MPVLEAQSRTCRGSWTTCSQPGIKRRDVVPLSGPTRCAGGHNQHCTRYRKEHPAVHEPRDVERYQPLVDFVPTSQLTCRKGKLLDRFGLQSIGKLPHANNAVARSCHARRPNGLFPLHIRHGRSSLSLSLSFSLAHAPTPWESSISPSVSFPWGKTRPALFSDGKRPPSLAP